MPIERSAIYRGTSVTWVPRGCCGINSTRTVDRGVVITYAYSLELSVETDVLWKRSTMSCRILNVSSRTQRCMPHHRQA